MDETSRLDPGSAAVVVIDMQNDFCSASGVQAVQGNDVSAIGAVVDNTDRLLAASRMVSVPIVFVRTTHSPSTDSLEWLARHPDSRRKQSCADGSWGAEFYRIRPQSGDIVVEKHRYNGFTGTRLAAVLASLERNSLLFCGVSSNVCVETTLRDAVCRDYLVTFVEDCCGAYSTDAHERAKQAVAAGFGLVTESATAISAWASAPTAVPAEGQR